MADLCAGARRNAHEPFVKPCDARPVGPAVAQAARVHRLDRRFELEGAEAPGARRAVEPALGLADHRLRPARAVLLGQRHVSAACIAARRLPRLTVQHQGQQAHRLGLVRHQLDQQTAELHRLLREPAAAGQTVGLPAMAVSRIDRLQHRAQARRPLGRTRDLERNAGVADLLLGAAQALADRRRPGEIGRRDARRVEAEHDLQHQRRPHRRIERRMGADEQQFQTLVGKLVRQLVGFRRLAVGDEDRLGEPPHAALARGVDQPAPRGRQQPGFRLLRHAFFGPGLQRGAQRIGQRILGAGEVLRVGGEKRQQAQARTAHDGVERRRRIEFRHRRVQSPDSAGRTSTT